MNEDKTVYFLRHGEFNLSHLTPKGIEDIRASSKAIKTEITNSKTVTIIYCNHQRIKQTAEITMKTLHPINVIFQELNEICTELSPDYKTHLDEIIIAAPSPVIIVVHQPDAEKFLTQLKNKGFYKGETIIQKGDYVKATIPAQFLSREE